MAHLLRAHLKSKGIPVGLFINDIRAMARTDVDPGTVSGIMNPTLVQGMNEVRLEILDVPSLALLEVGRPYQVLARFFLEENGPGSGTQLFELPMIGSIGAAPPAAVFPFHWLAQTPVWAWRRARQLQDGDEEAAWSAMRSFSDRLRDRDIRGFLDMWSRRFDDTDTAFDQSPGTARAYYARYLEMAVNAREYSVDLIPRQNCRTRTAGNGRLIQFEAFDTSPVLTLRWLGEAGRERFTLPCLLGNLDGRWEALR